MKTKQLLMTLVLILTLIVPAAPISQTAQALEASPAIESESLARFMRRLDELAYFDELGEAIPFTTVTPSDVQALRIDGLLRDLADRLDRDDTTTPYWYGDVHVQVHWPTEGEPWLSFDAERDLTAPITLLLEDPTSATPGLCNDGIDNDLVNPDGADEDDTDCTYIGNLLSGGGINARLVLSGTFDFASDDSEVYLTQQPTMTLSLQESDADLVAFDDQFGFVDIEVTGTAVLNEVIGLDFADPDGDGRITETEWTMTAIEDLATAEFDQSQVTVALEIQPGLDGTEAGTIWLDIDRSLDPEWPGQTQFEIPDSLRQFANIDSDTALAGLNAFGVSLNAALLSGEIQLPFLEMRISDAFSPGDALLELVRQQTDALVICGKTDTLPPTGDPSTANPLYCQALTYANPSEVISWTLEVATLVSSVPLSETVGVAPSENVKFERESTGERPRARVEFEDPEGRIHVAFPRVLSAQQLQEELNQKLQDGVVLHLDPDHSALMYDLSMELSPPMTTTQFAFADQLRQATHLSNLRSTANDDPEVGFTNVVLTSTFGMLLLDDGAVGSLLPVQGEAAEDCGPGVNCCEDGKDNDGDGLIDGYDPDCPAPNGPADRFFLVPADDHTLTVGDVELTHASPLSLTGEIGFLGVSADGPYTLTRGDHGDSILELDILDPGSDFAGIEDAIRIREFLADSGLHDPDTGMGRITRTVNLSTTVDLAVQGLGLSSTLPLSGNVAIRWDLAISDLPTIEPDPNFTTYLRPFDIAPTLTGVHADAEPGPSLSLYDPTRDFIADLGGGVEAGDVLNLGLSNLTDGSNCPSFQVDVHEITCVTGYSGTLPVTGTLAGGQENAWLPGDEYEIQGDPDALGNLVLDSFYKLATEMKGLDPANPAKAEFASPLPLIGLSSRDLATQLDAIAAAVVDVKSGAEDAQVVCRKAETPEETAGMGNLFCQAFTDVPEIDAAKWDLSEGDGTVIDPDNDLNTIGLAPEATTAFSISAPAAQRDDFQITVVFTDTAGTVYSARYPPAQINDLSDLSARLDDLFRRKYGAGVDLGFDWAELTPPGSDDPVLHLVPHLAIQEEGTRPYRLFVDFGDVEMVATDEYSQSLSLSYDAALQMGVAIPLTPTMSAYDEAWVADTTGLTLTISVDASDVELDATLGGTPVRVGVGANLTGTHTLELFTGTNISESSSATELTADRDIEALGVVTGTVLTNTGTDAKPKDATCEVDTIAGPVITCKEALTNDAEWEEGDGFELTAPSTTRLYDPTVVFSAYNIQPGTILTNTGISHSKNATCTIETPVLEANVLTCADALTPATTAWDADDVYEIEGIGLAQMAVTSTLKLAEDYTLDGFTDALTHNFGSADPEEVISATLTVELLEGEGGQVVEISYALEDLPDGPPSGEFDALLDAVQIAPIDWTLLPLPLELLQGIIQQNLDGQWWDFGLPLVGYDLSAGASDAAAGSLAAVHDELNELEFSAAVAETLDALCQLADQGLGQELDNVTLQDVQVKVTTDTVETYDCLSVDPPGVENDDVEDLEISFTLNRPEDSYSPAFGLGLPGLPVTADKGQKVQADAAWTFAVDFGLSRTVGPYIRPTDDDDLEITATASFPDDNYSCTKELQGGSFTDSYTQTRCLNAVMGFLPGTLFDHEADPSGLVMTTKLNLNADGDVLTFGQILDRSKAHTVQVAAEGAIDAAFVVDLVRSRSPLLPIAGTFHMAFDTGGLQDVANGIQPEWIDDPDDDTDGMGYDNVAMNVTSFFGKFIGPLVEDVKDFTGPLQPPIDTLNAPVPVISDLSKAIGQGPVSMMTMLKAVSGNDLTVIEKLGGFITFLNNLPTDDDGVWIGLGGGTGEDPDAGAFSLVVEETLVPPCSEDDDEDGLEGMSGACEPQNSIEKEWKKVDKTKTKSGREVTKEWSASASAEYTPGGISLPFLSDTRQIYGMLLGIDATLLRVDFGTLSASAGFSYSYYTVFVTPIGPIPVEFIVGGEVSISGRFAMGYDTRGLRHALSGESFTGEALLDGIFLDDYDADGNEVPELTFSATFYAGAAVSIRIVKVGLDMGVTFTVDLDLNDPNPDGKMYIEEIMLWRFNPVCLFEFTGTLEFFLRMYVEVDLFFFTARAEWYPLRASIKLFNVKCEPPDPVLAQKAIIDEETFLRLNVGSAIGDRNFYPTQHAEKFIVRQMTATGGGCSTRNDIHEYEDQSGPVKLGPKTDCPLDPDATGTWISVVFQGIKQNYFLPGSTPDNTARIYADAGSDDDVIRLEAGSDKEGFEIPFELRAVIKGGEGDDRITTGSGKDELEGGGGDDVINAGPGDDTINAGPGDDSVDAGMGDDLVYGGSGDDTLNGGPGIDAMDGGPGDDRMTGGPGLSSGPDDRLLDKDDVLIGGDGDDLLEGDYGMNYLFGDALQGYTPPPAETGFLAETDPPEDPDPLQVFHNALCTEGAPPEGFDPDAACQATGEDPEGPSSDETDRDTLTGGNEDDFLFGGRDNDSLAGGKGDDFVCGNAGHDVLDGSQGDDDLYGGPGNDQLRGGSGHDLLVGGPDDDLLQGDVGHDALVGDLLTLDISGTPGSDALVGGAGQDLMLGDSGWIANTDNLSVTNTAPLTEVLTSITLPNIVATGTVSCSLRTSVISGTIDLNGDEVVNGADDGFFEGFPVVDGFVDLDRSDGITTEDTGFIHDVLIQNGLVDASGDGVVDADEDYLADDPALDTGTVPGVGILGSGSADCLYGQEETDYLFGGAGDDRLYGDAGMDYLEGNGANDVMRGGPDDDTMYGDDTCTGSGCAGGALPAPSADPGNDKMFGDSGDDHMYGSAGVDTMRGGTGDDTMEGNPDGDWMYGDAGQDDMMGGSSPDRCSGICLDADDDMYGGAGHDVMTGDNATITRTGQTNDFAPEVIGVAARLVTLADLDTTAHPTTPGTSGGDRMYGEEGFDIMYGQGGGDHMYGGPGPDYMEGNPGGDWIYGEEGQDDILGGTSPAMFPAGAGDDVSCLDGDDELYGESDSADGETDGDAADVLLGDNGSITRPLGADGWLTNTYNGALSRIITLHDVETSANTDSFPHAVHGDDHMWGGSNDDVMYGQGGKDEMYGGAGHDYMEGNAGSDYMEGGPDQDDMIGGTGPTTSNDLSTALPGRIDRSTLSWTLTYTDCLGAIKDETLYVGDRMYGGGDADVMLGDNGLITRPLTAGGTWQVNTFNNAFTRQTWLFDIATLSEPADAGTSGGDAMWGNAADDLMYGQGSEDLMYGGPGDDYMEGNGGSDLMQGEGDEDDIIGGTGRINDDPPTGTPERIDAATLMRTVILGNGTEFVPYGDELCGGDGADVILGDNGIISRPLADGQWVILNYELFAATDGLTTPRHTTAGMGSRTHRVMQMVDSEPGEVAGSDLLLGGPGDDDMVGGFDDTTFLGDPPDESPPAIGDELWGGPGEDAMVGDSGVIEDWVLEGEAQYIAPNPPFFDDHIFIDNTLYRQVILHEVEIGGDDRMRGQEDGDWMHGGAGNDLMNGNTGNDRLFGDDGNDVMWGGFDHDHLYGGRGGDYLDVKPRPEMTVGKKGHEMTLPADLAEWFAFGEDENGHDNYQDVDYIYGGWGQDAMQADVGDNGPVAGDRLIDWVGAYNVYYLCPALYGEFVITRSHSPSVIEFLQQLAEGDGALQPADNGSSGFNEVAMVFPREARYNSQPVHPDNPGHFTCVPATPPDLAIDLTDGLTSVVPGQVLTYALTVSNLGELDSTGVAVNDVLPACANFVAASHGGSHAGGVVTWPAFDLAGGASLERTLTVELANPLPLGTEVLTNTASVTDDGTHGADPSLENNSASDVDTVAPLPDLVLDVTDGETEVIPGQVLTYTLTVSNDGAVEASGVIVSDALPDHASLLSASHEGLADSGLVTWPAFTLTAGASVTRTLVISVAGSLPAGVTVITNTATVIDDGSHGPDRWPADNTASDVDQVMAAPDLVLSMEAGQSAAVPGELLTYTLDYANRGDQDATGVVLSEIVPFGTVFGPEASTPGWMCSPGGQDCVLHIGDLGVGDGGTVTFAVTMPASLLADIASLTNMANISDDGQNGPDPVPANNSATGVTPVNLFPVATDDQFTVEKDSADNLLPVLANDVDPDGEPLTITWVGAASHGIVDNELTVLRYTPEPGFSGSDLFTYTVSDGLLTATATVAINITPASDAPPPVDDVVQGKIPSRSAVPSVLREGLAISYLPGLLKSMHGRWLGLWLW